MQPSSPVRKATDAAAPNPLVVLGQLERSLVLLLTRAACAERAAGFGERSLSMLLAAIEVSCFCPAELRGAPLAS